MKSRQTTRLVLTLCAALAGTSLGALAADAEASYKTHCTSCHGPDGKAKTRAGRMAGAKDLTVKEYQDKFTDEQMIQRLKDGVIDQGKEKMKPFKDKLTDDELKALIAFVRKFAK